MKQQRKFENNKLIALTNIGQRSLYFGLIILTFLIISFEFGDRTVSPIKKALELISERIL